RERLVRAVYAAVASPMAATVVARLKSISERQALRELLSKLRIDCVGDVGAKQGQYARLLRRLGFAGLILSFEPNPEVFHVMRSAFEHDKGWRGYNCGLGSSDGEMDFNMFEHPVLDSFLPRGDILHSKLVRTAK